MNMFRAFMELSEAYNDRQFFIDDIKKAGKNYNFSKFTDAQIYRMWQRIHKPTKVAKEPKHELDLDFEPEQDFECCDCGIRLTDFGQCPVCDLGEEELTEGNKESMFANNIDKDIISGLAQDVPDNPVLAPMVKCSKSAVANALYYVSKGEEVKFNLGNIKAPLNQIAHCWIEHNGEIAQTRNTMPELDLVTRFSVNLVPNDVDASKKLIIDLVNSINGIN